MRFARAQPKALSPNSAAFALFCDSVDWTGYNSNAVSPMTFHVFGFQSIVRSAWPESTVQLIIGHFKVHKAAIVKCSRS